MQALVGVDIGGTKTAVVLGQSRDGELHVLGRTVFATEPLTRAWPDVVAEIVAAAGSLLDRHGLVAGQLPGIGVSCGGPLDSRAASCSLRRISRAGTMCRSRASCSEGWDARKPS